ncbi:MAG: metalloregulator ArsR/SmtB family transcription factor [Gemmatimonadetes bacterium]|nr:metalloregulator ArsR/SmtB family transcription factor [Gemmatimonadota bacterium]
MSPSKTDRLPLPTLRRPGERCCDPETPAAMSTAEVRGVAADLELLAHPVRLQLLSVLSRSAGRVCVCDLESVVPVKQPTVSHHLGVLRRAGLVGVERVGLWAYYHVDRDAVRVLKDRIARGLSNLEEDEDDAAVDDVA